MDTLGDPPDRNGRSSGGAQKDAKKRRRKKCQRTECLGGEGLGGSMRRLVGGKNLN